MTRISAFRVLAGTIIALLVTLATAGGASAGQLANEGGTWVFRAAPGEDNSLRLSNDDLRAGHLVFSDTYDIGTAVPNGCYQQGFEQDDLKTIRCPYAPVRAELGDNSPSSVEWGIVSWDLPANLSVTIDGGPGRDRLTGPTNGPGVTLLGGDGNDELSGGYQNDVLDGGPGNDRVDGSGGNDVVRGGDGDDLLSGDGVTSGADVIDGGAGFDTIESDWIQNDGAGFLTVTLDGVANDGHPGEGDNVVDVESITVRQPAALVAGGAGVLFKIDNTAAGSSQAIGGPGDDNLRTYDYADTIDGKGGNDTIEGGYGDDTITGGPGRDTINAEAGSGSCNFLVCRVGSGNDTIHVRDGEQDSVVCGSGQDTVVADAIDTIAADCETVDRGAAPPPPPPARRDPPRPPSRRAPVKRCVVPKVKAGATLASAKKALAKKGCKAAAKKVRSAKVKKGRVVKLSQKAGKKLAYKKTVTVYVSRGRR